MPKNILNIKKLFDKTSKDKNLENFSPNWAKQLLKRHKNDDNEDPLLLIEWVELGLLNITEDLRIFQRNHNDTTIDEYIDSGTFGKVFSGKYHGRAVTCDADKEKERKKR
ncbi:unnamed protein product [Rhizophagus irregularis]|nr:unnamed protein product [Rhizophagus irregularis]